MLGTGRACDVRCQRSKWAGLGSIVVMYLSPMRVKL